MSQHQEVSSLQNQSAADVTTQTIRPPSGSVTDNTSSAQLDVSKIQGTTNNTKENTLDAKQTKKDHDYDAALNEQVEKEMNERANNQANRPAIVQNRINNTMRNVKPQWAKYSAFQPDWTAFEIEIQEMIIGLLEPAIRKQTEESLKIKKMVDSFDSFKRRLDEMDFTFQKVAHHQTQHSDYMNQLELSQSRMIAREQALREEIKNIDEIKAQMKEKFRLLKDDRSAVFMRMDIHDKKINSLQDQISANSLNFHESLNKQVNALRTSMATFKTDIKFLTDKSNLIESKQSRASTLLNKFSGKHEVSEFKVDRLTKQFNEVNSNLVNKQEFLDKMDFLLSQMNWCKQSFLQVDKELKKTDKYLQGYLPFMIHGAIDNTLKTVFDRKRYQQRLRQLMEFNYKRLQDKLTRLDDVTFNKVFYNVPDLPVLYLNAENQYSSDNSQRRTVKVVDQRIQTLGPKIFKQLRVLPGLRRCMLYKEVKGVFKKVKQRKRIKYQSFETTAKNMKEGSSIVSMGTDRTTQRNILPRGITLNRNNLDTSADNIIQYNKNTDLVKMTSELTAQQVKHDPYSMERTKSNVIQNNIDIETTALKQISSKRQMINSSFKINKDALTFNRIQPSEIPQTQVVMQNSSNTNTAQNQSHYLSFQQKNQPDFGSNPPNQLNQPIMTQEVSSAQFDALKLDGFDPFASSYAPEVQIKKQPKIIDKRRSSIIVTEKITSEPNSAKGDSLVEESSDGKKEEEQELAKKRIQKAHEVEVKMLKDNLEKMEKKIKELEQQQDEQSKKKAEEMQREFTKKWEDLNVAISQTSPKRIPDIFKLYREENSTDRSNTLDRFDTNRVLEQKNRQSIKSSGRTNSVKPDDVSKQGDVSENQKLAQLDLMIKPPKSKKLDSQRSQDSRRNTNRRDKKNLGDEQGQHSSRSVGKSSRNKRSKSQDSSLASKSKKDSDRSRGSQSGENSSVRSNSYGSSESRSTNRKRARRTALGEIEEATSESFHTSDLGSEPIELESTSEHANVDISEEDNNRLNTSMIDRLEERQDRNEQLLDEYKLKLGELETNLKQIQDRLGTNFNAMEYDATMQEFKENIATIQVARETGETKIQEEIQKNQKRQDRENSLLDEAIHIVQKKVSQNHVEALDQFSSLQKLQQSTQNQIYKAVGQNEYFEQLSVSILEMLNNMNLLMMQDEYDKKNMALMGVKEDQQQQQQDRPFSGTTNYFDQEHAIPRPNHQLVQVDKNCLSCSDQATKILSAFKMACLTYFPSPIYVNKHEMQRLEVVNLNMALLEALKKRIVSIKHDLEVDTTADQQQPIIDPNQSNNIGDENDIVPSMRSQVDSECTNISVKIQVSNNNGQKKNQNKKNSNDYKQDARSTKSGFNKDGANNQSTQITRPSTRTRNRVTQSMNQNTTQLTTNQKYQNTQQQTQSRISTNETKPCIAAVTRPNSSQAMNLSAILSEKSNNLKSHEGVILTQDGQQYHKVPQVFSNKSKSSNKSSSQNLYQNTRRSRSQLQQWPNTHQQQSTADQRLINLKKLQEKSYMLQIARANNENQFEQKLKLPLIVQSPHSNTQNLDIMVSSLKDCTGFGLRQQTSMSRLAQQQQNIMFNQQLERSPQVSAGKLRSTHSQVFYRQAAPDWNLLRATNFMSDQSEANNNFPQKPIVDIQNIELKYINRDNLVMTENGSEINFSGPQASTLQDKKRASTQDQNFSRE